jgi:hypothetical protein
VRSVSIAVSVAAIGLFSACGIENPSEPAAQPETSETTATPTETPSQTPSQGPSTPATPSKDCPATIKAVQADLDKATWGKGLDKARFDPVSVTICQYDAEASGDDYATVYTKRTATASVELFGLLNSADPVETKPKFCTKELGPTYVLRFTDADQGVLTYAVEGFGCRRLVATSFTGDGKPQGLAAPRQATPELLKSLGLRR